MASKDLTNAAAELDDAFLVIEKWARALRYNMPDGTTRRIENTNRSIEEALLEGIKLAQASSTGMDLLEELS